MLDEPSTATSRGVSNWPCAVPKLPKESSCAPADENTKMRSKPVSATTRRLECASQVRPLGYIAAGCAGGPASVLRNVTLTCGAAETARGAEMIPARAAPAKAVNRLPGEPRRFRAAIVFGVDVAS